MFMRLKHRFRAIIPVEKRMQLIRKITKDFEIPVEVVQVEGLLADHVLENDIDF